MALFDTLMARSPKQPMGNKFLLNSKTLSFMGLMPVAALLSAVIATGFLIGAAGQIAKHRDMTKTYKITQVTITPAEFDRVLKQTEYINPDLQVKKSGEGVISLAAQESMYAEFFYALSTLPGADAGIVWGVDDICIKDCRDTSFSYRARVAPKRQKFVIEESGN